MKKEAKIYEMSGCDWWVDYSTEDAKRNYIIFTGLKPEDCKDDWDEGWPIEVSENDLDHLKFTPDPHDEPDAPIRTFREELTRLVKENKVPGFFATTEY